MRPTKQQMACATEIETSCRAQVARLSNADLFRFYAMNLRWHHKFRDMPMSSERDRDLVMGVFARHSGRLLDEMEARTLI